MRTKCVWIVLLIVLILSAVNSAALNEVSEKALVVAMPQSSDVFYQQSISITVLIEYRDIALYNDGQSLSYHIMDGNGKMIQYENPRLPINLESGSELISITIPLDKLPDIHSYDKLIITLDIVDEKNVLWLSDAQFETEFGTIIYERNAWKSLLSQYSYIWKNQKPQLFLNCLIVIVLIALMVRIIKQQRKEGML